MIVTALSALAALGTAAWNQHKNNRATKEQRDLNNQAMAQNQQDLLASTYENSLESPTAKGQLENIRRNAERANSMRDNNNVAGHATHEQMLASKNATNDAVATATNNVVAAQERANAIKDEQFMNRQMNLNAREQAYKGAEAQARNNLTTNLVGSIGDIAGVLGEDYSKWNANRKALKSEHLANADAGTTLANEVTPKLKSTPTVKAPNIAELNNDDAIMSVVGNAVTNASKRNLSTQPDSDYFADIDTTGNTPKPTNNGQFNWFNNAFKNGQLDMGTYNSYLNKRRSFMNNRNNVK